MWYILGAIVVILLLLRKKGNCGCPEKDGLSMGGKPAMTDNQPNQAGPPKQGEVGQPNIGAVSLPQSLSGWGFKRTLPQSGNLQYGSNQIARSSTSQTWFKNNPPLT
jgi:hypothetical protein